MGDEDEIRRMETIMLNPRQYKIPDWFLTDKRTGRTVPLVNLSPTVLTPSSVRIWSVSRRSALTVVSVITGSSVSVVSIPRPLVAVDALLVLPRRSKLSLLQQRNEVILYLEYINFNRNQK